MTSLDLEIAVSVPVLCWELPLGCRIYHHHPKMVRSLEQLSRVADRYHYVHLVSLDAQLQLAPLLAACCCYHLDSSGHRIHIVCHAVGTDDIPLSRGCIEAVVTVLDFKTRYLAGGFRNGKLAFFLRQELHATWDVLFGRPMRSVA